MSFFKAAPKAKLTINQGDNIQARVRNELLSNPTSAEARRYRAIAADAIADTDFSSASSGDDSQITGYGY